MTRLELLCVSVHSLTFCVCIGVCMCEKVGHAVGHEKHVEEKETPVPEGGAERGDSLRLHVYACVVHVYACV